jgi:hypothetical protein
VIVVVLAGSVIASLVWPKKAADPAKLTTR